MKSAMRATVSTLGIYAGLLGIQHGVFEILQGDVAPTGIVVNAIGAPCQPDTVWHACLPAMTIIPNFLVTGILAVVVGLALVVWAAAFVPRRHGGLVLILLSITLLLVGGGFVPTFAGLVAGIAANWIGTPLARRQEQRPGNGWRVLAMLWPWTLIVLVLWLPGGWILGYFFNQAMLNLGFVLFFLLDLLLPLLTVFSGFAHEQITHR